MTPLENAINWLTLIDLAFIFIVAHNTGRTINKKIQACDRDIKFENRGGNHCIDLTIAGFEAFRDIIFENVYIPAVTDSPRNIMYTVDKDTNGLILVSIFILWSPRWERYKILFDLVQ